MVAKIIAHEPNDGTLDEETYLLNWLPLEEAAQYATVGAFVVGFASLVVAGIAFLFSQFSLGARIKRLQNLEEFAQRYHREFPNDLHEDEDGNISPVKDALVEYKRALTGLNFWATFGFGRLMATVAVAISLATAVSIITFIITILVRENPFEFIIITMIPGSIAWLVVFLIILILSPFVYRNRLDRDLKKMDDAQVEKDLNDLFMIDTSRRKKLKEQNGNFWLVYFP